MRRDRRKANAGLEHHRHPLSHQIFDDWRNVSGNQVYIGNRRGDGLLLEEAARLFGSGGWSDDSIACVVDRKRKNECDEGFVFRNEDGRMIGQHMVPGRGINV